MSRPKQTSVDVERAIARLVAEGFGAKQIEEKLFPHGPQSPGYVSRKTIQRRIKEYAPSDPSDPWSLLDADPEEARLVGDVLAYVFEQTEGRVWLTRNVAAWVARVRAAAPSIPPAWAYALARAYQMASSRQQDARCLDLIAASRLWEQAGGTGTAARWDTVSRACRSMGQLGVWIGVMRDWLSTAPEGVNEVDSKTDSKADR